MYIWSSSKCQLIEFGDICIEKFVSSISRKREVATYTVYVYSKNGFVSRNEASASRRVSVASFASDSEAVDLVQDIIDAYCSGVKVYSVSDRHRYC